MLKGFGEIDATKIAVSVIDIINNGSHAAFANFYFTDVIPLYILYLKRFMRLLNYNYSYLPVVMNYTNAVFGTLAVIPAFILIKKLFRNYTVAFCSVLALIFAPSFFQSTIMGFPHLISLGFLLTAFCFYLSGLDHEQNGRAHVMMVLSCASLTVAFLFKSDYVLASGAYFGFLLMKKIKDKRKIISTFLIIFVAGIFFMFFRDLILGSSSGTTMSKEGLSRWYDYSLIIPTNPAYLIRQVKPIAYGAGVFTFFLGIVSFIYYLVKRRLEMIGFIVSWTAAPIVFWIVMIGNNARHNMLTILPVLAIIIALFHEKMPKYTFIFTLLLIIGNYYITSPSPSILTPSGRIFESHTMLKKRMEKFHSSAQQIANINANKIAVLGYFHNPHVIFEIMKSSSSYKAIKIGREDYKVWTGGKEFVFIYFVIARPEEMEQEINNVLSAYHLDNYVLVSATYDLKPLKNKGLKTISLDTIERTGL